MTGKGTDAASTDETSTILAEVGDESPIVVRLGDRRALLATLPDVTFLTRYRQTFAS